MAAAGIGVDIVEISRMESLLAKTPRFSERFFSPEEQLLARGASSPAAFYAGRFAGHEAVLKALGTGFGKGIGRRDVSVIEDDQGRPVVLLSGGAQRRAAELGVIEVALSLSFTDSLVVANALALTEEVRPQASSEVDNHARAFAHSFKEARGILDELDTLQAEGAALGEDSPSGQVALTDVSIIEEDAYEASA